MGQVAVLSCDVMQTSYFADAFLAFEDNFRTELRGIR